ncbi:MAG: hypothetical protein M0Q41_12790 [Bacteroidales bacterium]|nr:hypothetical protein [Acholeplasmataceae bacterium]MCK9449837.1 hypothetical protein [Bacteroidales bacterium]
MNFKKNLKDLIYDAHRFQYTTITDTKETAEQKKPLCFFTKVQWLFIIISIIFASLIKNGFKIDFAGYIISGLSLFIGVFFTFLITLYDKFQKFDFSILPEKQDEGKLFQNTKRKNFFKRISVLSLYSVLLSILLITLLSLTLLFTEEINNYLNIFEFIYKIKFYHATEIIKNIFIFLYRLITFYFLFNFISITIFIISSYYDFLIAEIQNKKIK